MSEVTSYDLERFRFSANSIHQQMRYGPNLIIYWSWGTNGPKWGYDDALGYVAPYLRFRVTGKLFRGVVKIYHEAMDTYAVTFTNLKGVEQRERLEGLYCDNFMEVIDKIIETQTTIDL